MEFTTTGSGNQEPHSLDGEHSLAIANAYELIEAAQDVLDDSVIESALAHARAHEWFDVEFLLLYAYAARKQRLREDWSAEIDRLDEVATLTGDPDLRAIVSASRAEIHAGATGVSTSALTGKLLDTEDALAEAVVLLGMPNGLGINKPSAYVACGLAYQALGLWELEEEMLEASARLLETPLAPPLDRTQIPVRRVLLFNRRDAYLEWACALFEVGEREAAKEVAARALAIEVDRSSLPSEWMIDLDCIHYALCALADRPARVPFETALAISQQTAWSGGRACVLLGESLRAFGQGDTVTSAELAELSRSYHDDVLPNALQLALYLAAHRPPVNESALLYGQTLARAKWHSRLAQLGSARARIKSAQVMIEHEWLAQQAYVDELTGLANRHALTRYMDAMRQSSEGHRSAILMIDIDHFKHVNDHFGHSVGDQVLRIVGEQLRQAVRTDDLASRPGGDEFMVVMANANSVAAKERAWQILDQIQHFPWGNVAADLSVTVSIGVAAGNSTAVDELIRHADDEVYRVKKNGRATVSL